MSSSKDPSRLIEGDRSTASLLKTYAARTGAKGHEDGAAWQRLQPALDERLPARRSLAQARLLAGALTAALGLFGLARSTMSSQGHIPAAAPRAMDGAMDTEGSLGGGGASGAVDGDSRGVGGMEGASGAACRAYECV